MTFRLLLCNSDPLSCSLLLLTILFAFQVTVADSSSPLLKVDDCSFIIQGRLANFSHCAANLQCCPPSCSLVTLRMGLHSASKLGPSLSQYFATLFFKPVLYGLFIAGLKLQGAKCERNQLSLTNIITSDLPEICFSWKRIGAVEATASENVVTLPVYLNQTRVELLFTVNMKTTGEVPTRSFYERGVAFLSSFLSG